MMPGAPFNAAHAIANGVYVAAVNRVGFETGNIRGNRPQARDWSSGVVRSLPIPSDKSWPKHRTTKRPYFWLKWTCTD